MIKIKLKTKKNPSTVTYFGSVVDSSFRVDVAGRGIYLLSFALCFTERYVTLGSCLTKASTAKLAFNIICLIAREINPSSLARYSN